MRRVAKASFGDNAGQSHWNLSLSKLYFSNFYSTCTYCHGIHRYGHDEEAFEDAYPEHEEGITALLRAIRTKGQAEGKILTRKRGKGGE